MKKQLFILSLLFLSITLFSQNKIDAFLGEKGIFSTFSPKNIQPNGLLTFDVKVTLLSTPSIASIKPSTSVMYFNTKDGYIGVDHSSNSSKVINEDNSDLDFIVETLTKQGYKYSNVGGVKKVEKLETNLINNYNKLPFVKSDPTVAKPKKYLNNTITAAPYFINTIGMQKKYVRYCYGTASSLEGSLKSYLGCYGVGFYNVSDNTILCVATEHPTLKIEITKIEKVNISFKTSQFKS